jgi:AAA+ superfamily predicted ATPase
MAIYENNVQYIMDELGRLDLILQIYHLRTKALRSNDDPFRGFYISDEEAAALLASGSETPENPEAENIKKLEDAKAVLKAEIDQRIKESIQAGAGPRLRKMGDILDLSDLERDALIICAACDLDPKYEGLYGYFHNDLTRKRPSLGLVLDLLCDSPEERVEARRRFLPGKPLMDCNILEVADGSGSVNGSDKRLSSGLRMNPDVLSYILGSEAGQRPRQDRLPISAYHLPADFMDRIENLIGHLNKNPLEPAIIHIHGKYGSGRRAVVDHICNKLGKDAIHIDIASFFSNDRSFEAAIIQSLRDSRLGNMPLCIEGLDSLSPGDPRSMQLIGDMVRAIAGFQGLAFLISRGHLDLGDLQRRAFCIQIPEPGYQERQKIWEELLPGNLKESPALASKFRFTPGQIEDAMATAGNLAVMEGLSISGDCDEKTRDKLKEIIYEACRIQSSRKILSLAKRIEPRYRLDDVVLPKDRLDQLQEIKSYIDFKGKVYGEWGFEEKLSLGKGLNILFSGESGTGKTMAAEAVALELGLEMYKIDLSSVVSKYIGETEKNLNRIFSDAEQGNAILFFDEADAIFGKRSEVKDAHDRYANVEISYLLQKMEEHQGIVVLATNFDKNMDDAFTRRMHFKVEFPFPEEEYRLKIWKSLMPEKAPRAGDVDYNFLARRFKISGGGIKNILVAAAFLAAEDSGIIGMKHLIRATWGEYRKAGKICNESDFGKYYHLVSGD